MSDKNSVKEQDAYIKKKKGPEFSKRGIYAVRC